MSVESVAFAAGEARVTRAERRRAALLRFSGPCSAELLAWLPDAFKGLRHALVLNLRGLSGIEAPFVRKILDLAPKKPPLALADPPDVVLGLLDSFSARERVALLSGEAALEASGDLEASLAQEREALRELESRFRVSSLWRRVDLEGAWLCALCGGEAPHVRVRDAAAPGDDAFRAMRKHLLEDCSARKSGRQAPLPACVLDAFLAEVNQRKAGADAERKRLLAQEIQTLQTRVESLNELERSAEHAMRRQLHLVPIDPEPDPVADISVLYRPLQSVSGDFLDFYQLGDDRLGVAVGDVSGHGIETAIVMGMAKMALRVRSQALGSLHDLVGYANRDLHQELRHTAFVTAAFLAVERSTRRMTYVRAGHPKPLVVRAGGQVEVLEAGGLPLGVDRGPRFDAALQEREVQLAPGDLVFLYSDGLLEAAREGAEQFGIERIIDVLRAVPPELPVQGVLAAVVASLERFLSGAPLNDDLTAVCLRIKA